MFTLYPLPSPYPNNSNALLSLSFIPFIPFLLLFFSPDSPSPYPSPLPTAEESGSSPGLDAVFRRLVDLADVVDTGCAGQVWVGLLAHTSFC